MTPVTWPDGKSFAFTVFDDTDHATLENVRPVYELLAGLGMRTTKSVWALRSSGTAPIGGETAEDPEYRAWTLDLQAAGFEIASHGARDETSTRAQVVDALDRFREVYGTIRSRSPTTPTAPSRSTGVRTGSPARRGWPTTLSQGFAVAASSEVMWKVTRCSGGTCARSGCAMSATSPTGT